MEVTYMDRLAELTAELREELWATERRVKQLRKALEALDAQEPAKAEAPKPKQKKPKKHDRTNWTPRESTLGAVAAAMRAQTKPVSISETADLAGVAVDTARRSLDVLREQGEVRLVGIERRGPNQQATKVFLPMPPTVTNNGH
jgi:ribosomal protein S25